jgi:2-polyprenyl-3-methyl-5-hydroxy-6-metoxy-1,4-benzoquinol methylase
MLIPSDKYPDGRVGNIVRCQDCGLVYRNPHQRINTGADRKRLYRTTSPGRLTNDRKRLFKYYSECVYPFREYNRILDVGSGSGFFLKLCREQGWEIFGVELNPELAEISGATQGVEVFNGSFEESYYPADYFDVVTLWNVLEHMEDHKLVLTRVYRILRPRGCLFLRFANADTHVLMRRTFFRLSSLWKGIRHFDVF